MPKTKSSQVFILYKASANNEVKTVNFEWVSKGIPKKKFRLLLSFHTKRTS